jgi:hypothetical protein
MQVMLIALISGPALLAAKLGRGPQTVELLKYGRDELAMKSRPLGSPDN